MTLDELNNLEDEECKKALLTCCSSVKWVDKMIDYRPYGNLEELLEKAAEIFRDLDQTDWLEAFSHHARLGRQKKQESSEKKDLSQWERQEQAGTSMATDNILNELEEANIEYENKFGFLFLLCATGKSATEMLDSIHERMPNELNIEMTIAMEEQNKITKLRLKKLLS